ncbi:5-deoxy-glucuronate isomerase [Burkholderia pseudomallei]|uniref:5-deoxy-glucuronate isomerase n=1 Tax=Burkholderia TaxID=32008 RepID=UPI00034B9E9D|nr:MULTISPECIES: 5-deoxy-glucuronate isomerase [Burkholderia]ANW48897.1 5-deoxy-glucuronate isomerase [Burkholderia pseudomallei]ANW54937.1 5-deoxy-glucuronate isomerase [Burkholderia pseudomallei]KGX49656.1 5-deoxy-glucuronate isomerase [Burkholderia pseudomallei TSV5]MCS6598771.1 5-deoxy-glucuronate isomerase [Burkholderia pseudomallei]MCT7347324.1 5-deoxy-glucuronate isomerase [Burkholderia pseudomallei]
MSLLVKGAGDGMSIARVTPESAHWKHVGFAAYRLKAGEAIALAEAAREMCIVVLTGTVDIEAGDGTRWTALGSRDSVFDGVAPYALYLPPKLSVIVRASRDAELGVASAPAAGRYPARLIKPSQMRRSVRGSGANTRYVCDILPQTEPAEALLVVEVRTPSGHSSSYPPHKHDTDDVPVESSLEETYYHRVHPPQGFVFQRVYTDSRDLDESMAAGDHDVVLVPRGYHPVVVPYGYESYYLNVMAGPTRVWHFKNDPAHEWMLNGGR